MRKRFNFLVLVMFSTLIATTSCKNDNNNDDDDNDVNPNTKPVAAFTITPLSGTADTIFTFDGSESSDQESSPEELEIRWDWKNDGTWDTEYSTVKIITHQYASTGSFDVTMEVKDPEGLTDQITHSLTVTEEGNLPPSQPSDPTPANNEENLETTGITISWQCNDPEQDALEYDVFFGTEDPPALVSEKQQAANFNPGNLDFNTTYFWKVIAYDTHGNYTEGPVWQFTTMEEITGCPESFTDPRDGQVYHAVEIGDQCWMKENLNIGNRIDGVSEQTDNDIIEKYCYEDEDNNCNTYGGLYQWNEMMDYNSNNSQGICPPGWHIPDDIPDWVKLEVEVGMEYTEAISQGLRGTDEGDKLKSGGSSGFEALLGGYRNSGGAFNSINLYATFYTSSPSGTQPNLAWSRYLFSDNGQILRSTVDKTTGLSVRCIKD